MSDNELNAMTQSRDAWANIAGQLRAELFARRAAGDELVRAIQSWDSRTARWCRPAIEDWRALDTRTFSVTEDGGEVTDIREIGGES